MSRTARMAERGQQRKKKRPVSEKKNGQKSSLGATREEMSEISHTTGPSDHQFCLAFSSVGPVIMNPVNTKPYQLPDDALWFSMDGALSTFPSPC